MMDVNRKSQQLFNFVKLVGEDRDVPIHLNPLSANHDCSRRHSYILFHCFTEKISPDISCESSARQRIHMKHQALFS